MTALKTNKAFTLIELLIVIAVIGIIAIAVLAALNPVEQINRSRDTASVADSEQLQTSTERFYASKNYFPWMDGIATGPADYEQLWQQVTASLPASTNGPILDQLSQDTSELRESFADKVVGTSYNPLFIYHDQGSNTSTYVCFLPQSDEFQQRADERCADVPADYPGSACTGVAGTNYYCIP